MDRKEYYRKLREAWAQAKELAKTSKYEASYLEAQKMGLKVSMTGYTFCKLQMEGLRLEGTPYIDAKTYNAWKKSGFIVKRGEKSKLKGVTFVKVEDEDKDSFMYPKAYSLFHRSQVEPLK